MHHNNTQLPDSDKDTQSRQHFDIPYKSTTIRFIKMVDLLNLND